MWIDRSSAPQGDDTRLVIGQWKAPIDDSPFIAQRFTGGYFHVTLDVDSDRTDPATGRPYGCKLVLAFERALAEKQSLTLQSAPACEARQDAPTDLQPAKAIAIQPYVTASFRMGVAENRLFTHQPGLTLGFRKSFERNHGGYKTRIAELSLVASKHLGERAAIHVGGALWDASLAQTTTPPTGEDPAPEVTLHGHRTIDQLRVFGGLEARPLDKSSILIDLSWAPEFCYACVDDGDAIRRIKLRPELSWGVRYEVASWMRLESGVRVPDIGNFNLLDAQIFGQVTFASYALKRAVDDLR